MDGEATLLASRLTVTLALTSLRQSLPMTCGLPPTTLAGAPPAVLATPLVTVANLAVVVVIAPASAAARSDTTSVSVPRAAVKRASAVVMSAIPSVNALLEAQAEAVKLASTAVTRGMFSHTICLNLIDRI